MKLQTVQVDLAGGSVAIQASSLSGSPAIETGGPMSVKRIRPSKSLIVVHCEVGETREEGLQRYEAEHGEDSIRDDDQVIVVSHVSPGEATGETGSLVIENGRR